MPRRTGICALAGRPWSVIARFVGGFAGRGRRGGLARWRGARTQSRCGVRLRTRDKPMFRHAQGQIARQAARIRQLEAKLSQMLGDQAWRESGLGAPEDIDKLERRITELEQHVVELTRQLEERGEELDAARAANREMITQFNAVPRRNGRPGARRDGHPPAVDIRAGGDVKALLIPTAGPPRTVDLPDGGGTQFMCSLRALIG